MWSKTWSDKEREIVIEEVRKRPYIYDPRDPDYKNKERRMDTFDLIARIIAEATSPGIEPVDGRVIAAQWKILKDTFNRTRKANETKRPSPYGIGTPPVWRFYRQLEFLTRVAQPSPYSLPTSTSLGSVSNGIVQLKTTDDEDTNQCLLDDEKQSDHSDHLFASNDPMVDLCPGLYTFVNEKISDVNDDDLTSKDNEMGNEMSQADEQPECSGNNDRKRFADTNLEEYVVEVVKRRLCSIDGISADQKSDKFDHFGKVVASTLRELASYDAKLGIELQHELNNVLHNYALKKYG